MADIIPASWLSESGIFLSEMVTQIVGNPIEADKISLNEYTPTNSNRGMKASLNVGSAAVMQFWTEQTTIDNPDRWKIFSESILGGYSSFNGKKNIPMAHPFLTGSFAKDIIDVKSVSVEGPIDDETHVWNGLLGGYNVALVTINFESLPYLVNNPTTTSDEMNLNWLEFRMKATNQRTSVPLGMYVFAFGTTYPLTPNMLGTWITQPLNYLEITVHQVRREWVTTTLGSWAPGATYFKLGWVNDVNFNGCVADTLCLDSMIVEPYSNFVGQQLLEVKLNILYNQNGWNSGINPLGDPEPIVSTFPPFKGPFNRYSFKTLMGRLNPL